ncbi:MAG: hypothetical protein DRP38_08260, partial [Thermotogae bacterium]
MKILVAYDGSESSKKAVDFVREIAKSEDEVIILTVIPAELLSSTFTKMLLPTIDLATVAKDSSFKERAEETLREVAEKLRGVVA